MLISEDGLTGNAMTSIFPISFSLVFATLQAVALQHHVYGGHQSVMMHSFCRHNKRTENDCS